MIARPLFTIGDRSDNCAIKYRRLKLPILVPKLLKILNCAVAKAVRKTYVATLIFVIYIPIVCEKAGFKETSECVEKIDYIL